MSVIGQLHSVATVPLLCTEYKPVWALEPVCTWLELQKIIVPTGYGTTYHVACT